MELEMPSVLSVECFQATVSCCVQVEKADGQAFKCGYFQVAAGEGPGPQEFWVFPRQ
jgi:hypothetical protein